MKIIILKTNNMKIKPYLCLLSLFFLFCFNQKQFGQDNIIFNDQYRIHTDRDYYISGENIHFKIYQKKLNKETFSKVVYLSLTNSIGELVCKAKVEILNGLSYGSLEIPQDTESGYYWLYTYSKWQRNFGIENYNKKRIFIVNPLRGIDYSKANITKSGFNVMVFPEGGSIIGGVDNNIVLIAKGKYGQYVDFEGDIIDDDERIVSSFKTTNCIGNVNLRPLYGMKYKLKAKYKQKTSYIDLLIENKAGLVYDVDFSDKNQAYIKRHSNPEGAITPMYLSLYNNGICYLKYSDIDLSNELMLPIPKNKLIEGVNLLVARDNKGKVVYKKNIDFFQKNSLKISLTTSKNKFNTREKVDVRIKIGTLNDAILNANLSVSIAKLESNHDLNNVALINKLSNKGTFIFEFFDEFMPGITSDDINQSYANYLRTIIPDTISSFKFDHLPEISSPYLEGEIINQQNDLIKEKALVFVTMMDSLRKTDVIESDKDGRFIIQFDKNMIANEVLLQLVDTINATLKIKNSFEDSFPNITLSPPLLDEAKINYLQQLMFNYQIMEQYYSKATKEEGDAIGLSNMFYGKPDTSYVLKKYIDLPSMEEVFHNLIYEVAVKEKKREFTLYMYDKNKEELNFFPLVLIDGVPVTNVNSIMKIIPSKVWKIDIINSYYTIGKKVFGGIISIFSKDGDFAEVKLNKRAEIIGYKSMKRINTVKNDDISKTDKHLPDLRNTLYWNPEIIANEKGLAEFSFNTSDETGKFLIKIEGISMEGDLGRCYHIIEVNNQNKIQ